MNLLLANIASTLFMTGLIWFVQLVHYPLHAKVGSQMFPIYQQFHMKWTSWVVIPPMITELLTSIALWYAPPLALSKNLLFILMMATILIWLSTGLLQAPTHGLLLEQFDPQKHKTLVWSNWIRTILWTTRSLILLWIFSLLFSKL